MVMKSMDLIMILTAGLDKDGHRRHEPKLEVASRDPPVALDLHASS